jgi:aldose sugar dehydrogenase
MRRPIRLLAAMLGSALATALFLPARGQATPTVLDPNLGVRAAASGLVTPISIAFLGPNDFLVLEKDTGKVQRVETARFRAPCSTWQSTARPSVACSG